MKKAEKPFFVENLSEELKNSSSIVLVDFSGINFKSQQELKRKLEEVGAKMLIVKNTLFKLAARAAKLESEISEDTVLTGPSALIVTESDPIAPIQILGKYAKELGIPNFKVGLVEGKFQDKESLIAISKLPGKEVLLAKTLGVIGETISRLTRVLQGNSQKLVYLLKTQIQN